MKAGVSESALRERYRDEQAHTDKVAHLAASPFDRARRTLCLPAADRRLLLAACRLHDLGYGQDPAAHAEVSARAQMGTDPEAAFTNSPMRKCPMKALAVNCYR